MQKRGRETTSNTKGTRKGGGGFWKGLKPTFWELSQAPLLTSSPEQHHPQARTLAATSGRDPPSSSPGPPEYRLSSSGHSIHEGLFPALRRGRSGGDVRVSQWGSVPRALKARSQARAKRPCVCCVRVHVFKSRKHQLCSALQQGGLRIQDLPCMGSSEAGRKQLQPREGLQTHRRGGVSRWPRTGRPVMAGSQKAHLDIPGGAKVWVGA